MSQKVVRVTKPIAQRSCKRHPKNKSERLESGVLYLAEKKCGESWQTDAISTNSSYFDD
jgi:hypothetical protein